MKYKAYLWHILASIIFLILLIGGFICLYLIYSKELDSPTRLSLLLETGKSLLYLMTVLLIGGFISTLFKSLEKSRKADKSLHDLRVEFLNELLSAYRKVINSKRNLRAIGLTTKFESKSGGMSKEQKQPEVYQKEMQSLIEVESELNRLNLELGNFPQLFSANNTLMTNLSNMEAYLRELLTEYEKNWPQIQLNSASVELHKLEKLIDFTGEEKNYNEKFFKPYEVALTSIRQELLPFKRAVQDSALTKT